MLELRPYQQRAIEDLRESLRRRERPVLSAPTGSGKTAIASTIFALARLRNRKTIFCVPFLSLINQTYRAFIAAGMDEREIGIIQGNNDLTDWSRPIQICSVDTLNRRPKLPEGDLVIFDEVHRNSKLYERWMASNPQAHFIGLSATPWSKGMDKLWSKMIIVATIQDLIDQGYLANFKYFAPAQPDLSGIKIVAGDYHEGQLGERMCQTQLVADIVTTWMQRGQGRPTFCFCVNRKHAVEVQFQFEKSGIPCGYIDAYTPVEEREAMIEKLRTGELKIISNIGTMTTGVDAPFVSCLILARPTKSESLYIQIIGRVLRIHPDKDYALILDHSNTGLNLGLPTEINYETFNSGQSAKAAEGEKEKKTKEKKDKVCPICAYVVLPNERKCVECGHEFPPPPSDVIMADGELKELERNGKIGKETRDQKQMWYSGLLYIAEERGYKSGWVANQYRSRFGVWPRGLLEVQEYPTQAILNYVKNRQIAYAKMREKQNASNQNGNN